MNKSKGIYLAFITAVISGISIFVNKFAVGYISPPLVFTATKNFLVGLFILAILISTKKLKKIKHVNKKDRLKLFLISIVGGSLPFYLFFTGLAMIPAVNAALIHKTLVLWVAILAVPFLGEKLTKLQAAAVLILFGSNLFVGGFEGFMFSQGELMVLGATILWAVENVVAKKALDKVDPDLVTWSRMGFGSLFLIGASIAKAPQGLMGVFSLEGTQMFWIVLTAVFLMSYVMSWYRALKEAPAILVSSVLVISTIITNVLSSIFITHKFNPVLVPQVILVVIGLSLYWISLKGKASNIFSVQ